MKDLVAILMAGGAGTRFWPVSTEQRPKQFLNLFGGRTLLQESLDRLKGLVPPERVLVLTSQDFVPLVCEQLPEIPPEQVIGEPLRRDTAAAVALAALVAERLFGSCTTAVLTTDHRISPIARYQEVLRSAAEAATQAPALYTFGIVPRFPATGYGYLHRGEPVEHEGSHPPLPVAGVPREARPREGPGLRRVGGLLLEQRHVRLAHPDHSRRDAAPACPSTSTS